MNRVIISVSRVVSSVVISIFLVMPVYAQVLSSLPNGFPTNDADEGTFILASQGLSSLGAPAADGTVFNVHIRVPITESFIEVEIFDPDLYAADVQDPTNPNHTAPTIAYWDYPPLNTFNLVPVYEETTRFELFPDVNITGNSAGAPIHELVAQPSMDNQWIDFSEGAGGFAVDPTDPLACEQGVGAQFCYYHLVARWVEETAPGSGVYIPKLVATTFPFGSSPGNLYNAFIVASNGLPFLAAGSSIGLIGFTQDSPTQVPATTSYNGTLALRALVDDPGGTCALDIYDGDYDRYGETGGASDESDDANTPADAVAMGNFFPFPLSADTLEEGAIPGIPADNHPTDASKSIGEPVIYTVMPEVPTLPYGVADCCVNDNPSGNREWELYRIASTDASCPDTNDPLYDPDGVGPLPMAVPDVTVNQIGAGFHTIAFSGMDQNNLNFLTVSADIFSADVFDFGDAPNSYLTLAISGGPQHSLDARLRIGDKLDAEFGGIPGVGADGDDTTTQDDEDGVASFAALDTSMAGGAYNVDVVVDNELDPGNQATLYGWIDFDGNGTFDVDESASAPVDPGDTLETLAFVVPADVAAGDTYARFRLTTDASISTTTPGGMASDGEVEDYPLTITEPEECIPCKGQKSITLKVHSWSYNRDEDEMIRVRVGDVLGELTADERSNTPVIFGPEKVSNGAEFTITVPDEYLGQDITVTVEGASHRNEYGKALFKPNCDLPLYTKSGSSYIKFKVTALEKNSDDECACVECESGPAKITFKITNTYGRDQGETVRVRVGSIVGPVLFSGQVLNGNTFEVMVPEEHRGSRFYITVQGDNHHTETVKAEFDADCKLRVGDHASNNGYLHVKIYDLEGDTGEICPLKCDGADTSGYVKDHFSSKSYNNNDGSRNWSGPWKESDKYGSGPWGGYVRIHYGVLKMKKRYSKIQREVNVCGSDSVWLKFKYKTSYRVDSTDKVYVEVSPDGGSNWHKIATLAGRKTSWTEKHYDISQYASENTTVRFRIGDSYNGYSEYFYVSWVKVTSS